MNRKHVVTLLALGTLLAASVAGAQAPGANAPRIGPGSARFAPARPTDAAMGDDVLVSLGDEALPPGDEPGEGPARGAGHGMHAGMGTGRAMGWAMGMERMERMGRMGRMGSMGPMGPMGPMGMRHGPGGPFGPFARQLELTDAQRAKLADIRDRQARRDIQARADLQIARLDLRKLVAAEKPEATAINTQIDRMARLRAEMAKSRMAAMLDARALLTPEQLRKLHALRTGTSVRSPDGIGGGPSGGPGSGTPDGR
jgi:Spy/CpxP family protein refolding chaperone